ncbi:MAG: DUF192 domain-containing protein [Acidimicrobiia bacterium]
MWAAVGFGLAFLGVVVWFLVASAALDDGADDGASTGALRVEATGAAVAPFTGLTEARLALGGDCLRLVVADDLAERAAGLRNREAVAPYDGMLFVFDAPTTATFTMSGVSAPLDIGFYDGDGTPVSRTRMQPCAKAAQDCPVYRADGPFVFAVETRPGGLAHGALARCP